jgi:hypothetical protein
MNSLGNKKFGYFITLIICTKKIKLNIIYNIMMGMWFGFGLQQRTTPCFWT